jgi:hypothetical protein
MFSTTHCWVVHPLSFGIDSLLYRHFLLANAGVNTHQLVNDLNAIQLDQSLEPVASLYSTDIEVSNKTPPLRSFRNLFVSDAELYVQGFLRHAHQDTVANVLDDSQDLVRAYSWCCFSYAHLPCGLIFCYGSLGVKR